MCFLESWWSRQLHNECCVITMSTMNIRESRNLSFKRCDEVQTVRVQCLNLGITSSESVAEFSSNEHVSKVSQCYVHYSHRQPFDIFWRLVSSSLVINYWLWLPQWYVLCSMLFLFRCDFILLFFEELSGGFLPAGYIKSPRLHLLTRNSWICQKIRFWFCIMTLHWFRFVIISSCGIVRMKWRWWFLYTLWFRVRMQIIIGRRNKLQYLRYVLYTRVSVFNLQSASSVFVMWAFQQRYIIWATRG